MPEMTFRVRWPDGAEVACYSPSRVVADYFRPATVYPLPEFLSRSRAALGAASERVRARHGRPCGRAMAQLAEIERRAKNFADLPHAEIAVLAMDRAFGPETEPVP